MTHEVIFRKVIEIEIKSEDEFALYGIENAIKGVANQYEHFNDVTADFKTTYDSSDEE